VSAGRRALPRSAALGEREVAELPAEGKEQASVYATGRELLRDELELLKLAVTRYLKRRAAEGLAADGDLYRLRVGPEEVRRFLEERPGEIPGLAELRAEVAARREELARREALAVDAGLPLPLSVCAGRFGLSRLQRSLLVAALAPELDALWARVYTAAWADFTLKRPPAWFLAALVADGEEEELAARAELLPGSLLLRARLLALAEPPDAFPPTQAHRPVHVADRLIEYLLAALAPAEPAPPFHLLGEQELPSLPAVDGELADRLAAALTGPTRLLVLPGPDRRRVELLALAVARRRAALGLGRPRALCLPCGAPWAQGLSLVAEGLREAMLLDALPLVEVAPPPGLAGGSPGRDGEPGLEPAPWAEPGEPPWAALGRLLADLPLPQPAMLQLAEGTAQELGLPPQVVRATLPPLPLEDCRTFWQELLDREEAARPLLAQEPAIVEELARRHPPLVERAERVVREALGVAALDGGTLTRAALAEAANRQAGAGMSTLVQRIVTEFTFADLILPEETLALLRELCDQARLQRKVLEEWGFAAKLPYGRGLAALFGGLPGTGKTMAASVIAREMGQVLFRVDLSKMVSRWVGETEKNLARVFDEAQASRAMLLFDEADALFSRRTEVKSSVDRYANLEVNYLLQRLESFDGLVVLTSNFEAGIDEAFRRRLRFRIDFPMPDQQARLRLWQSMFPAAMPREPDLPLADLAEEFEMAGGPIKQAALRGAFLAAAEGRPVGRDHLFRATEMEYRELGRVLKSQ